MAECLSIEGTNILKDCKDMKIDLKKVGEKKSLLFHFHYNSTTSGSYYFLNLETYKLIMAKFTRSVTGETASFDWVYQESDNVQLLA